MNDPIAEGTENIQRFVVEEGLQTQSERKLVTGCISAPVSTCDESSLNLSDPVGTPANIQRNAEQVSSVDGNVPPTGWEERLSLCLLSGTVCNIPEEEPPRLADSKKTIMRLDAEVAAQVHLIDKLRSECDQLRVKVRVSWLVLDSAVSLIPLGIRVSWINARVSVEQCDPRSQNCPFLKLCEESPTLLW
jgi:hypothetical protein